ncbi:DNA repair protein for alkylated DNA [Neokomagataea thailandica NBRC 106555]|nr:DNA repair protein for alkylated DNA [Neokomagataea thailandica NBRC 106555]
MPNVLKGIAKDAAQQAGYDEFEPQSCLINRYETGARMGMHQDKDEGCLEAPVVSLSIGIPARFMFGGVEREQAVEVVDLYHGDAVIWGGPSRLAWHGIKPLRSAFHPLTGALRYNLTFRAIAEDTFRS